MKRVVYLLLFMAACKWSSPEKKVDKMASVMEQVLNEDITRVFTREKFEEDVEHISEVICTERKAHEYIAKDTIYREYLFSDHRLHQVASVTRRMRNDTLTIRYDTAGRILSLIHSDGHGTYNTNRFKYDADGRRIGYTNRFFSTESGYRYEYNKRGDTVLVIPEPGGYKERICISIEGDETTVTRQLLGDEVFLSMTRVQKYNRLNQLTGLFVLQNGKAGYKLTKEYDSHGNVLLQEEHQGDRVTKDGYGDADKSKSIKTEYTYDKAGNWITRKEQQLGKSQIVTTMRKITYR